MDDHASIQMFLSMFVTQLPILFVCLIACLVILIKWKPPSSSLRWALLGFGLGLVLCIAIPVVQTTAQHWAMQGGDIARRAFLFGVLSFLWSGLRAVSYALLLAAVFAGRPAPDRARA